MSNLSEVIAKITDHKCVSDLIVKGSLTEIFYRFNGTIYKLDLDTDNLPFLQNGFHLHPARDRFYVRVNDAKKHYLHQLVLPAPEGCCTHHRDCSSGLNNCRSNLVVSSLSAHGSHHANLRLQQCAFN